MSQERNLGFTEASIGLTIITCLLVALGYLLVQRLSDSPRPVATMPAPATFRDGADGVRTALGTQPSEPAERQTSYAPQWLAPQSAESRSVITR
jgi:hypothetical protein